MNELIGFIYTGDTVHRTWHVHSGLFKSAINRGVMYSVRLRYHE